MLLLLLNKYNNNFNLSIEITADVTLVGYKSGAAKWLVQTDHMIYIGRGPASIQPTFAVQTLAKPLTLDFTQFQRSQSADLFICLILFVLGFPTQPPKVCSFLFSTKSRLESFYACFLMGKLSHSR